jgi:hypothetical protein
MAAVEGWTQNDLEPPLSGTCMDYDVPAGAAPKPVDLSAASLVTAHVRRTDWSVISREVVRGTDVGSWTLPWVVGDLSMPGQFGVQVQVTWPGVRPQTFPGGSFPVSPKIA